MATTSKSAAGKATPRRARQATAESPAEGISIVKTWLVEKEDSDRQSLRSLEEPAKGSSIVVEMEGISHEVARHFGMGARFGIVGFGERHGNRLKLSLTDSGDTQARDAEVQRLVDASNPDAAKADEIMARMRARAVALVMGGTSWLTATELFKEAEKKPSNVHTTLARWLEQGRIFALEKNGVRIFPRYAFDSMLEPVPMLKEVLAVLAGRSPFQIASWFESPSNFLKGKRPREVLELDGLAVVTAAKRLVEGAVHG